MRIFAAALSPPAEARLWVQPDGVLFELRMRVTPVAPSGAGGRDRAEAAQQLPAGIAFVVAGVNSQFLL